MIIKSFEARGNDITIHGTTRPNFHIWHKLVPRIFYHSKISLRLRLPLRHNIPQASNETFCSRGAEIRQLIGSRSDDPTFSLFMHDCHQIIIPCAPFESLGSNVNKYRGFKISFLQNSR